MLSPSVKKCIEIPEMSASLIERVVKLIKDPKGRHRDMGCQDCGYIDSAVRLAKKATWMFHN